MGLVMLGVAFGLLALLPEDAISIGPFGRDDIVIVIVVLFGILVCYLSGPFSELARYSRNPAYVGHRAVELSIESLVYRVTLVAYTFDWSRVTAIARLTNVYLITISDFPTSIVVPLRAFLTPGEADRFFETARRYWKGEPDPDAAASWPPPPTASHLD
ncbi:MAG: hypothetical protein ACLQVD_11565 [Capsulimonadaceae bacterium]